MDKAMLYSYRYPEYSQKLRPIRGLITGIVLNAAALLLLCAV